MAAVQYGYTKGETLEQVTEVAGTHPATTADTEMATLLTALNTTVQGLEAAVTSAIAAAQLIGTGDASAEIDAIDTAWAAILTAINAAQTQATATKAATLAAVPDDTVEVAILTGQAPLDVLIGLDLIKHRIATSSAF